MTESIGFMELNSIAKGVESTDFILKAAQVRLIFAKSTCPGKYSILFAGEVAAVKASMDAGLRIGQGHVVDSTVIARIHPQVIQAISQASQFEEKGALGVIEFFSVTAAIYGGDAAVKAADVNLIDIRLGFALGGKSYVVMTGEVAAVQASVDAGSAEGKEKGLLVSSVVIPSPRAELFDSLL